jgi:septal ring factor EnvC (AmiA/AmiB activator)
MKKFIIAALAISFGLTTFAQEAVNQTAQKHPRVHQVNKRIVNQEKRIKEERKEGEMTKAEAKEARKNISEINMQKKVMRQEHNGHLTKKDQKELNKELNKNSKEIGK